MTLRTPRRRISPRTRLRYRAIREFFRRALGSTSQQNIHINSSIAVNVTDLKRKIVGLEQQLDEVNRHCNDIVSLDDYSRKESISLLQSNLKQDIDTIEERTEVSSARKSPGIETQLTYKSSRYDIIKSEESDFVRNPNNDIDIRDNEIMANGYDGHVTKVKNKKVKLQKISNASSKLHKHKTKSAYDNVATAYSTSSFHSLENSRTNHFNAVYPSHFIDRNKLKEQYMEEIMPEHNKNKKYKENMKKKMGDHYKNYEDKPIRTHKKRRPTRELDPDFIADIIRKQYKPIDLYGRKEFESSQISAPVCRDQEFSLHENIQEDSELCSCFYGGDYRGSKPGRKDLYKIPSMCDISVYGPKKKIRQKPRKAHIDVYNNSEMYDLFPVKERSSPKTQKKFMDDNNIPYEYNKEVPPSPRSLRPRLNLKAQNCTELENYIAHNKRQSRKHSPKRSKRYQECLEEFESDIVSEVIPVIPKRRPAPARRPQKHIKVPVEKNHIQEQDYLTTCTSSQYPQYVNEQTSITGEKSSNKPHESELKVDKTDKALCEIKDILQSFLHEIKKETVASQSDKSEISSKVQAMAASSNDSNALQDTQINNNMIPNSNNSFNNNNFNATQCGVPPYITPFTNPCCYPVMSLCPMNCPIPLQNGYMMPSQSVTCINCVKAPKESMSVHCCHKTTDASYPTETDELIKEIYKFVAQGPANKNENDSSKVKAENKKPDTTMLTSRSAGDSYKYFLQDANVGTQPLKCYSKSCEAIGSRLISDPYYSATNVSFSDTLLEKLSLEPTPQSYSENDSDTPATLPEMTEGGKFTKVLRTFGLFKKKKKDAIEELSASVIDEVKNKKPKKTLNPYKQDIAAYAMHGQEYYRQPPVEPLFQRQNEYPPLAQEYQPRSHEYYQRPHEYQQRPHECPTDYHPPYNPGVRGYPSPHLQDPYAPRYQTQMREHHSAPTHDSRKWPAAPPFNNSYENNYDRNQPSLCLKEIEVKSTGTQSERKMSIFKIFSKKTQRPTRIPMTVTFNHKRAFSTQTPKAPVPKTTNSGKPLFNWKNLQSKPKKEKSKSNSLFYSLPIQKELAEGDLKMRNAMIKKLFYKRNPFSPRNLIMKTLLGKDKASYGEPPTIFRPRMFL